MGKRTSFKRDDTANIEEGENKFGYNNINNDTQ